MGAVSWAASNLMLSGFLLRPHQMALTGLAALRHLSAMGHALEGMARVEFGGGAAFSCEPGGLLTAPALRLLPQLLPPGVPPADLEPLLQALRAPGPSCVVPGDALLSYLRVPSRTFAATSGILLAYLAGLHVATFAALVWRAARGENR